MLTWDQVLRLCLRDKFCQIFVGQQGLWVIAGVEVNPLSIGHILREQIGFDICDPEHPVHALGGAFQARADVFLYILTLGSGGHLQRFFF